MTNLHSLAERPPWRRRKGPRVQGPDLSCVHRGEQLRTVPCESCSGTVRLKAFACDVHGECIIKGKPSGTESLTVCLTCDDRKAVE